MCLMKCTFHYHFILPYSCLKQDEIIEKINLQTYTQTADAGVSNRLKKVIQIDVLLTLYELIEFCLLVIYNKPGVVQYIYCWSQVFIKKSCFSFSEHHICINKQ